MRKPRGRALADRTAVPAAAAAEACLAMLRPCMTTRFRQPCVMMKPTWKAQAKSRVYSSPAQAESSQAAALAGRPAAGPDAPATKSVIAAHDSVVSLREKPTTMGTQNAV